MAVWAVQYLPPEVRAEFTDESSETTPDGMRCERPLLPTGSQPAIVIELTDGPLLPTGSQSR